MRHLVNSYYKARDDKFVSKYQKQVLKNMEKINTNTKLYFKPIKNQCIRKALSIQDFIYQICLIKLAKSNRIQDKALAKHFRSKAFACQNRLVSVLKTADKKILIQKQILESQAKFVAYNIKTLETIVDISCNYIKKGNHDTARKYSYKALEFERQFDEAYPHVFESILAVQKAAEPFSLSTSHNTPSVKQQSRTLPFRYAINRQ